jgi:sugar phosphate isomerase/epimerase
MKKLDRIKRGDESFDELLERLASNEVPITVGAWHSEIADRSRDAVACSRENLER